MCVIAVYPRNVKFNYGELKHCFTNNPDGAGVMWQENGHVHIRKGFMKQKALFRFLRTLPDDVDRVIHFRIATSGKISVACCHPFPVVNDYKKMMNADIVTPVAYAHNGILTEYTPKKGIKSPYSDTMVFGKEVLDHLTKMNISLFDPVIDDMIEATINGDRMVIMNSNEFVTMGRFLKSSSGAIYSNASYSYNKHSYVYSCSTGSPTNKYKPMTLQYEMYDSIVSFVIKFDFDPSETYFTGWTNTDYEDFLVSNLEELGVSVDDVTFNITKQNHLIYEVCCVAYWTGLQFPLYNIYDGKTFNDFWHDENGIRNTPVHGTVTDLTFDDKAF